PQKSHPPEQSSPQRPTRRYIPNRLRPTSTTPLPPCLNFQATLAPTAAARTLRPPRHHFLFPETSSRNSILPFPNSAAPTSSNTMHIPIANTESDLLRRRARRLQSAIRPFAPCNSACSWKAR